MSIQRKEVEEAKVPDIYARYDILIALLASATGTFIQVHLSYMPWQ